MSQLSRALAFGRNVPPRQLARRVWLVTKHRASDMLGAREPSRPAVKLRQELPKLLMPARDGMLRQEGNGLVFRFIGREMRFEDGRIDWTAPGSGAENQLLRMNMAYMEYLEEVDDGLFANLVDQWLTKNATLQPGAWRDSWNSYALSIRIAVWLQQLSARKDRLEPALLERMTDSLARQVGWLERHLETDIGGNHLVKNIKALLWAGAAFEGTQALYWQRLGRRMLVRELERQILPDGVHYERSPSYHAQVFVDLLECRVAIPDQLPALDAALSGMAQATADLAHPDGFCAQFNDAGLTMAYTPSVCLDAFVQLGFERPKPRRVFAFRDAGYFGWRDDRLTLIADCGPIAPDALPAHGHGDILSFELSSGQQRVIVDQGVFEYVSGRKRALSRATRSHNTLAVADSDQAEFFGAFRMGRRPRVLLKEWAENVEGVVLEGQHDGYTHLQGSPKHHRRIKVGSDGMMISDTLEAGLPITARIGFLLHPEVAVEQIKDGMFLLRPRGAPALIVTSTSQIVAETAVWWPDMGKEQSTTRLAANIADARSGAETHIYFAKAC